MSIKLLFAKVTNHLFLTYELVLGNRRQIIPTVIGLIIALTVISQSGVLIESYRQEILEEVIFESQEDKYYVSGDISIEMRCWNTTESDKFTNYESYNTLLNQSITQVDYSNHVKSNYWYTSLESYIWLNQTEYDSSDEGMHIHRMPIYASSAVEFYTELNKTFSSTGIGRLPENSSEILLLHSKWEGEDEHYPDDRKRFENVTLDAEVNITLCLPNEEIKPNKTVKIVGIIESTLRENRFSDNITKLLQKYFKLYRWEYSIVSQPLFLEQVIKELFTPNRKRNLDGKIIGKIFLDKTGFDAYNINSEKNKLENFIQALRWKFNPISQYLEISSRILFLLETFEITVFQLLVIMLFLSVPVLCIALYLIIYSFGLIRKQKQEQIGIIKTRGGSWFQVFIILLGEMLFSSILAVLIGYLLSMFLTDVVMRSSNYLEFSGAPMSVHISIDMVRTLILLGLILALLLNFRNI
ncbi:MAG: FtsX-like permease family protein, partial [Candidatus Thorarchaeota archaeon]